MNVLMGGVPIGRLEQMDAGVLAIEYVDRWLAADRVQILLSMSPPCRFRDHRAHRSELMARGAPK
ncbi:hypothetical protein [Bradyrhizobium zhanjiangense]|uniref:Uncharacterized protein n=1 Tax=Bradyrhizobium zhanjiangense TaxID=1325107 RepID=A0A4Q0Q491_9BRAD|nr:hypothetical protein [Bradyrhizobium zhanjiangense]RXG83611.1 hypothetical protein EAS61_41655 [Bradyrhizobium zhanjiangense]